MVASFGDGSPASDSAAASDATDSDDEEADEEASDAVLSAARLCDIEALAAVAARRGLEFLRNWRERPSEWSLAHFGGGEVDGLKLLKWLLDHGISLLERSGKNKNYAPKKGGTTRDIPAQSTCLHVAAHCGKVDAVRFILDHTLSSFAANQNFGGQTALQMVITGKHKQSIIDLFKRSTQSHSEINQDDRSVNKGVQVCASNTACY